MTELLLLINVNKNHLNAEIVAHSENEPSVYLSEGHDHV